MNGHWLVSDFDHRDPQDDLHDIDTGKYLGALQELSGGIRQMLQESDMHCEVREVEGAYRIVKIVKKREAAYLQGSDHYFVYDHEGKRIPLTEEEYNKLLGLTGDPEDVFNASEVDLQTIGSEHTAPMDVWDVIYDATEFLAESNRLMKTVQWERMDKKTRIATIAHMAEKLIYSADYFPYPQDKRIHGKRAREIAEMIKTGNLSKLQMCQLLGDKVKDKRPEMVKEFRTRATKMPKGKEKAQLLIRANKMVESYCKDRRNYKGPTWETIGDSDRSKLWELWRRRCIELTGSVALMPWQFEKAFRFKLQRQVLKGLTTKEEADQKLAERMEALFGDKNRKNRNIGHEILDLHQKPALPEWLANAPEIPAEPEEGYAFAPQDWLPTASFLDESSIEDTEISEDWQAQQLMEGGE
jgi:hypothetical protein